jgi:hypothetical protein
MTGSATASWCEQRRGSAELLTSTPYAAPLILRQAAFAAGVRLGATHREGNHRSCYAPTLRPSRHALHHGWPKAGLRWSSRTFWAAWQVDANHAWLLALLGRVYAHAVVACKRSVCPTEISKGLLLFGWGSDAAAAACTEMIHVFTWTTDASCRAQGAAPWPAP